MHIVNNKTNTAQGTPAGSFQPKQIKAISGLSDKNVLFFEGNPGTFGIRDSKDAVVEEAPIVEETPVTAVVEETAVVEVVEEAPVTEAVEEIEVVEEAPVTEESAEEPKKSRRKPRLQ